MTIINPKSCKPIAAAGNKVVRASSAIDVRTVGCLYRREGIDRKQYAFLFPDNYGQEEQKAWLASLGARRSQAHEKIGIYCLSRGYVLLPGLVVMNGEGQLIQGTVRKPIMLSRLDKGSHGDAARLREIYMGACDYEAMFSIDQEYRAPGFLLASAVYNNYYHWLVECIPQLLVHAKYFPNLPLCVPSLGSNFRFRRQSIEFFAKGIDFIQLKRNTVVESLFFSDPVALNNTTLSPLIKEFFAPYRGPSNGSRLYISRNDAAKRVCLNESKVITTLHRYGFRIVSLSSLDFVDQMHLFQSAEIVVSPHGAGLANLVFMRAGARVVELVPSTFNAGISSYYALSELFELDYTGFICQAVAEHSNPNNNDFECDAGSLDRWLRETLGP